MTAQRQYELVYIVSPEASDEQAQEIQQLIQDVIARYHGTIDRTDNWGRRKLAFPIKHKREGTYVVLVMNGLGDMVKELERRLKVHDFVLRHLVVRVDEDLRKAERARTRREEDAARRRAARGIPAEPAPAEPIGDTAGEVASSRVASAVEPPVASIVEPPTPSGEAELTKESGESAAQPEE
ncbi:MAG: 30S ribosomal protein S6 [Luteitalea sp.]|nr:30S ribosomal protein S6 [Luteitalea sp.]